jgi:hypothetical protein
MDKTLLDNMKASIKKSSYDNYLVRLRRLQSEICKKNLEHILKNPKECYKSMEESDRINGHSSIANYITPLCKVFTSNPEFLKQNQKSYDIWKTHLMQHRQKQEIAYKESKPTQNQHKNYVSYKTVLDKFKELSANEAEQFTDFTKHMRYLLLAFMIHTVPKRSDYGKIEIVRRYPKEVGDRNILVLKEKNAKLIMNKYKTVDHFGILEEDLPDELIKIVKISLGHLERQYVFGFMSNNNFVPYENNRAYGGFFTRTCKYFFGKEMGPSLWRHAYIIEKLDPSKIAYKDHERIARLMGHSMNVQRLVYHWVDKDFDDKSNQKSKSNNK